MLLNSWESPTSPPLNIFDHSPASCSLPMLRSQWKLQPCWVHLLPELWYFYGTSSLKAAQFGNIHLLSPAMYFPHRSKLHPATSSSRSPLAMTWYDDLSSDYSVLHSPRFAIEAREPHHISMVIGHEFTPCTGIRYLKPQRACGSKSLSLHNMPGNSLTTGRSTHWKGIGRKVKSIIFTLNMLTPEIPLIGTKCISGIELTSSCRPALPMPNLQHSATRPSHTHWLPHQKWTNWEEPMHDKWDSRWDFSNKYRKRLMMLHIPGWCPAYEFPAHNLLPCHLPPPEISDGPRSEWPVAIAPSFHRHSPPHCSWPRLQREASPDSWTHATSSKLSLKNSRQHYLSWKRCRTPWLDQGGGNKMLDLELGAIIQPLIYTCQKRKTRVANDDLII